MVQNFRKVAELSESCTCVTPSAEEWQPMAGQPGAPITGQELCVAVYAGESKHARRKVVARSVSDLKSRMNTASLSSKLDSIRSKLEQMSSSGVLHQQHSDNILTYVSSSENMDKTSFKMRLKEIGLDDSVILKIMNEVESEFDSIKSELFCLDFPIFKLSRKLANDLTLSYIPADIAEFITTIPFSPQASSLLSGNGKIEMSTRPTENVTPLMWLVINMNSRLWDLQFLHTNTIKLCYDLAARKLSKDNIPLFVNALIDGCIAKKASSNYNEQFAIMRAAMNNVYNHVDSSVKNLKYNSRAIKVFNQYITKMQEPTKDKSGTLSELVALFNLVYMKALLMATQNISGISAGFSFAYSQYIELDPHTSGNLATAIELNKNNSIIRSSKTNAYYINTAPTDFQIPVGLNACETSILSPGVLGNVFPTYYNANVTDSPSKIYGELGILPCYIHRFKQFSPFPLIANAQKDANKQVVDTTRAPGIMKTLTMRGIEFKLRGAISACTYDDMPLEERERFIRNRTVDPDTFWHTEAYLFSENGKILKYDQYVANHANYDNKSMVDSVLRKRFAELKRDRQTAIDSCQGQPKPDMGIYCSYELWLTDPGVQSMIEVLKRDLSSGSIATSMLTSDKREDEVMDKLAHRAILLLYVSDSSDTIFDILGLPC